MAPENASSPLAGQAIDAAMAAARKAHEVRLSGLHPQHKGGEPEDWITEGDHKSQEVLFNMLPKEITIDGHRETVGFLGEETLDPNYRYPEQARWRWIVDPIDGTLPYKNNSHTWCVSVALQKRGVGGEWESRIGVLYQASPEDAPDKLQGKIFRAEKGEGAFVRDLKTGEEKRLARPAVILPEAEYCGTSDPKAPPSALDDWAHAELAKRGIKEDFRRSCCYAVCELLEGKKCAVVQGTEGPYDWDIAAVKLLGEEAGAYAHFVASTRTPTYSRYGMALIWDKELFDAFRKHMPAGTEQKFSR